MCQESGQGEDQGKDGPMTLNELVNELSNVYIMQHYVN